MYDEQESRKHELAPELAALERQLRGIAPTAPAVDRDRLMFDAGRASVAAEGTKQTRAMYDDVGRPLYSAAPSWAASRFWPAATFAMTAATLLLATMLVWQNQQQSVVRDAVSIQPAIAVNSDSHEFVLQRPERFATRSSIPAINGGYLGLRYVALTCGVGALPSDIEPSSADNSESTIKDSKAPTTQRGLLREFLPPSSSSSSRS
jgi:hypothetical protein